MANRPKPGSLLLNVRLDPCLAQRFKERQGAENRSDFARETLKRGLESDFSPTIEALEALLTQLPATDQAGRYRIAKALKAYAQRTKWLTLMVQV